MAKVIIVDLKDNIIGLKPRDKVTPQDTYRITSLWITNAKGQVLLAKRKLNKKIEPGCWGPAVSGTVEEGETYDSNIIKEALEEIGLESANFAKTKKYEPFTLGGNYFVQRYEYQTERDIDEFTIQESEVEKIAWFDIEELKDSIRENPKQFVASAQYWGDLGLV